MQLDAESTCYLNVYTALQMSTKLRYRNENEVFFVTYIFR